MSRLVEAASGLAAAADRGRPGGIWPDCGMGGGGFERALAALLLGLSMVPMQGGQVQLPQETAHERFSLDADRAMAVFRMRAGTVYAAMGGGEETAILAWAAGRCLEIRPCGDLFDAAALNLGDTLVQALESGSRCFHFDFGHVRFVGDDALGILQSLREQLSREGRDWELTFTNVAEDLCPFIRRLGATRTKTVSGDKW